MNNKGSELVKKETEQTVLSFLKLTKEGKYAVIDKSSLKHSRLLIERDTTELVEEDLHYSIG